MHDLPEGGRHQRRPPVVHHDGVVAHRGLQQLQKGLVDHHGAARDQARSQKVAEIPLARVHFGIGEKRRRDKVQVLVHHAQVGADQKRLKAGALARFHRVERVFDLVGIPYIVLVAGHHIRRIRQTQQRHEMRLRAAVALVFKNQRYARVPFAEFVDHRKRSVRRIVVRNQKLPIGKRLFYQGIQLGSQILFAVIYGHENLNLCHLAISSVDAEGECKGFGMPSEKVDSHAIREFIACWARGACELIVAPIGEVGIKPRGVVR